MDQKTSQYLVLPPFASCSVTPLRPIALIRKGNTKWWPVNWCPTPLLCEVDGYWCELEHAVVHVDPENPKNTQWVTCLVSMQAREELGHFQLPGIVYRSL